MFALIIHGGAGANPAIDYTEQRHHLDLLIRDGARRLAAGDNALDTVAAMVEELERCGLYVAGKGAGPNKAGIVELDASIMDGATQAAGSVAAIRNIVSPVTAARAVMRDQRHVMLAGEGATVFAVEQGLETVADPAAYYTDYLKHHASADSGSHGTVGAVALDTSGRLAAATSTGGTFVKLPGRVGDTPLIGSGTWADGDVAVSATGLGEYFIRTGATHDVAARVRYGKARLDEAANAVLGEVARLGGDGGLIAVDRFGNMAMPYNSEGMKRAAVSSTCEPVVRVFEAETGLVEA